MNQRRFPRVKYRCEVSVSQQGHGKAIAASTENIGMGGVCVLLEQGLEVFSPVALTVHLDDGAGAFQVKGTIVWVVRRGDLKRGPSFDTGIEFSELSPENRARLEAILDKVDLK